MMSGVDNKVRDSLFEVGFSDRMILYFWPLNGLAGHNVFFFGSGRTTFRF